MNKQMEMEEHWIEAHTRIFKPAKNVAVSPKDEEYGRYAPASGSFTFIDFPKIDKRSLNLVA